MVVTGWHFLHRGGVLLDGRAPPPRGEWLVHEGVIEPCKSGLHFSERPIDALLYADSPIVCRVSGCDELVRHGENKIVCRRRRIDLGPLDVANVLRAFARACALDVARIWCAPPAVVEFLETGDPRLAAAVVPAARLTMSTPSSAATVSAAKAAVEVVTRLPSTSEPDVPWAIMDAVRSVGWRAMEAVMAAAWAKGTATHADLEQIRLATTTAQNDRLETMLTNALLDEGQLEEEKLRGPYDDFDRRGGGE